MPALGPDRLGHRLHHERPVEFAENHPGAPLAEHGPERDLQADVDLLAGIESPSLDPVAAIVPAEEPEKGRRRPVPVDVHRDQVRHLPTRTGGPSGSPLGRSMASQQQVQVPPRYARVNAWVISRDTDAEVRWLATVFGAVETPGSRMLDPDGDIGHVEIEIEIGNSVIMLFDAKPDWPLAPAHLRVYVGDVVAAVDQAVAAGWGLGQLRSVA